MDGSLIEKRLAHILSTVDQLDRLGRPKLLDSDPVQLGYTIYALQTAVQAAIDVAAMIVTERKLGEPSTNRQMFEMLAIDGWIPEDDISLWKRIVSFRNIVVHRYLDIDHRVIRAIVEDHLGDFRSFAKNVRDRLRTLED